LSILAGSLNPTILVMLHLEPVKKLIWDANNIKATNCPEADSLIKREYRKGWDLI